MVAFGCRLGFGGQGGNCKGKSQEEPSPRLQGVSWQNQAATEAKVPPLQLEQGCSEFCGASSAPLGHKSLLSCLSSYRILQLLKHGQDLDWPHPEAASAQDGDSFVPSQQAEAR